MHKPRGPKKPQMSRARMMQEAHNRITLEVTREHPDWPMEKRAMEIVRRVHGEMKK
jgi:hypothetical protein